MISTVFGIASIALGWALRFGFAVLLGILVWIRNLPTHLKLWKLRLQYSSVNQNRRKILADVGLAGVASTGWLTVQNEGNLDETIEDVQDIPARLSTGGTNPDGSKTFTAAENFNSVSWQLSTRSANLVIDIPEDYTMDWFSIESDAQLATVRPPADGGRVKVDLFDQFVDRDVSSGTWRLVAHQGPQSDDAERLGHVVWDVEGELSIEGVPTITTRDFSVELTVKNTGNAPVLVKKMSIDDLEAVPVGGMNFLPSGEEGRVRTIGTPFQDGCIPEEYTLRVSGSPSSHDSIDISSTMGGDC